MDQQTPETLESSCTAIGEESSRCPWHAKQVQHTSLDADDELVFSQHKRIVTRYSTSATGVRELRLYYGEKEVLFDEPQLFTFGEQLAQHARFVAGTAATWGEGYDWPAVQALLEQLLDAGILHYASSNKSELVPAHGPVLSPLPPAPSVVPRDWFECEAITGELTDRPVELGYLELIVPIYRVAHMAMDAEGRQVGEANVFPMQLRVEVPTEWRICHYPGSRYQHDHPMNVTALKSMIKHWKQTMVILLNLRSAYLQRFPHARSGWTAGDLQRLSALVLTLPAYLLMRSHDRVENGLLHPVFSSMYRVTDGVRMTMHRMLLTSINEPSVSPEAMITAQEIHAYAESNNVFIAEDGVCAGPRAMIDEFLRVLVDGKPIRDAESVVLEPAVQAALQDLNPAFDYGLYGLQAYAVILSRWPVMARTYERLLALVAAWPGNDSGALSAFREHLQRSVEFLRSQTRQHSEERRVIHERMHADLYAQCAQALGAASAQATLARCIAPVKVPQHAVAAQCLRTSLRQRFCGAAAADATEIEVMVDALMEYFSIEQAIVRAAVTIQQRINHVLGRSLPTRPLTTADLALHYRLIGLQYQSQELQDVGGRLPNLLDELEEELALRVVISADEIEILDGPVH